MNEIVGNPISLNVAVEQRLFSLINNGMLSLRSEIVIAIDEIFTSKEAYSFYAMDESFLSKIKNSFNDLKESFKNVTVSYAKKAKEYITKYAKLSTDNSIKGMTGLKYLKSKDLDFEETEISIAETTKMFETIADKLVDDVEANVYRVVSENSYNIEQAKNDIFSDLDKRTSRAISHAANVSKCQTQKTFNICAREVLISRGITKFKWIYTYRSHTHREWHEKVLKNKIFHFDRPPVIQLEPQIRGYPSQLPNCKCKMAPVIDF